MDIEHFGIDSVAAAAGAKCKEGDLECEEMKKKAKEICADAKSSDGKKRCEKYE